MLRISTVESPRQCRLILEGRLIAPWAAELKGACERARGDLHGRELIVEIRNLVAISQEGESLLLALMNEGVKFRAYGVFAKHILKQLAERTRREVQGHKLATSQRTLNQSEQ
jgi:hypothetical protein